MKYNRIQKIQFWQWLGLLLLFTVGLSAGGYAQGSQSALANFYQGQGSSEDINKATAAKLKTVVILKKGSQNLVSALRSIARQTGLKLSYSEQVIPHQKKVTIKRAKLPAEQALWDILEDTGYRFGISASGQIVLFKIQQPSPEFQQETITGTISDVQSGETLPGVNILVKGTSTGTSTDAQGAYELTVESLQDTLVFSFVGYQTQQIPINGRATINIAMQSQVITGQGMVVTALGIERESQSLSYSTEKVNNDQLTQSRELNVINSLSGRIAGLSIHPSSQGVGSSSRVLLRGNRSITGSSQPLYVVDGVPIRGGPKDLNSDNIESINVLKGPNAAALYGSSAQNGAIVITTRQPESGEAEVSISNHFMVRDPVLLRKYQNQYGQGSNGVYSRSSEYSWGPKMEGQMVEQWSHDPNLSNTKYAFVAQPDNVSDGFQSGYENAANLSVKFGGQNVQAVVTYTNTNAAGVVPKNTLARHNFSTRVTGQFSDNLSVDGKLSFIQENIDNQLDYPESFQAASRQFYKMPRNIRTEDAENFQYTNSMGQLRQNYWNPGSNGGANPYWTINRDLNYNDHQRVIALGSVTYDFTDYLNLIVRASYDGESNNEEQKLYNDTYITADFGQYSTSKSDAFQWNGDFLFTYQQDINSNWNVEANAGGNIKQERNNSISSNTGEALTIPNFFTLSNTQNIEASQSEGSPIDVLSAYGRANISWNNSIFLDLTARNDWSSTLPPQNRSYFYPSVGLSVVLSNLITLPEAFSYARIRGSWAKVGNGAPPFRTKRTAEFLRGGRNGFLSLDTIIPAENLKPEQTKSYEFGVDADFFKNRLGLDVTAYSTRTYNQLFTVAVPSPSGASEIFTNGGDVSNKGIEATLTAIPLQLGGFKWNINLQFSANRNIVESISDERPQLTIDTNYIRDFVIEEGEPFGQIYSRDFVEDDEGRVIIQSNGMPEIAAGKTELIGNYNPDWTGSIGSRFDYKNFSLSFLIEHRQGGAITSYSNAITFGSGLTKETLKGRNGGLIFGENFYENKTAVLEDGSTNNIEINAENFWRTVGARTAPVGGAFVDKATNTRLRELTIGYSLSQSVLEKTPISNLRVSLVGRNLFFISRASDYLDPDKMTGTGTSAAGFESFTPPSSRTYGLNINVDF